MTNRRLTLAMVVLVLVVWVVGTWITKYTLEEMAILTPIAVIALGALAAILLLWAKVVRESLRRRRPTRSVASNDDGRLVDDREMRAR